MPNTTLSVKRLRGRFNFQQAVLWVAFLQGLAFLFIFPPWQYHDEPTHFEYAWLIADRGRLPEYGDVDQTMRRQVASSMLEHDFYDGLAQPNLLTDEGEIWIGVSELNHPPAYYLLVSLPLRLVDHLDVTTQLYVARFVSLGLFVLTISIAIGIVAELTPPNHPLRWSVPLAVALLPTVTNTMTAVNNDAGAVFVFSLFLWGAVRTIRHGFTWQRLLWLGVTVVLALLTKNTIAGVVVLAPLALLVAFWQQRGWPWRWFSLACLTTIVIATIAVFDVGVEAAYWYRQHWRTTPGNPVATRTAHAQTPFGNHAVTAEVDATNPGRRLLVPLPPDAVSQVAGTSVTYGGWLWASRPVTITGPGLLWSQRSSRTLQSHAEEPIDLTTVPGFVAYQTTLPADVRRVHYTLFTRPADSDPATSAGSQRQSVDVYLDGAFLVAGTFSPQTQPTFEDEAVHRGTWNERPVVNLVRNPSGERPRPHLRPWVTLLLDRYGYRLPLNVPQVVAALFDVAYTGDFLVRTVVPSLFHSFFARFAWGHVTLPGTNWAHLFITLVIIATAGTTKWLVGQRRNNTVALLPTLIFLSIAGLTIWLGALVRPLPALEAAPQLPAARYVFPAIVPTIFYLVAGWWAFWPRRYRRYGTFLLVAGAVVLDVLAIVTIWKYYMSSL